MLIVSDPIYVFQDGLLPVSGRHARQLLRPEVLRDEAAWFLAADEAGREQIRSVHQKAQAARRARALCVPSKRARRKRVDVRMLRDDRDRGLMISEIAILRMLPYATVLDALRGRLHS
jgi:hypothetical protein